MRPGVVRLYATGHSLSMRGRISSAQKAFRLKGQRPQSSAAAECRQNVINVLSSVTHASCVSPEKIERYTLHEGHGHILLQHDKRPSIAVIMIYEQGRTGRSALEKIISATRPGF